MRASGISRIALVLLLLWPVSGCTWLPRRDPFGPSVACRLPQNLSADQLIQHLNRNVASVQGWRSSSARISARGMPGSLSADIAVAAGRHFRLVANSLVGPEVDLGSNPEHFWFWSRADEPHVMYANHEDTELAQQRLQIPFEPDWLLEALGVEPLAPTGVTLHRPEPGKASLVSEETFSSGRRIHKVIVVDACHGRILEHSLYEPGGRLLARAKFGDHRMVGAGGETMLPHRIQLDWPQARMSLTITLDRIDVNPQALPPQIWEMPSADAIDLGG